MSNNLQINNSSGVSKIKYNSGTLVPLFLIIFYLFLEYVRPQLVFPPLRVLHLPAITLIFILISILFSGNIQLKDKQTLMFLLLLVEMIIHGPIARNNFWAFQIFYAMAINFIAYVGIINIVNEEFKYKILFKYWLILSMLLAIIGILNRGGGVGGFIGDENDFCMAMNMALPFGLFGVISANKKTEKIYYLVLTCLILVSILRYSRGGFIGMVSVIIYCWIKSNAKIVFSFIMGILIVFALIATPSSYWDRMSTITNEYKQNKEGTSYGTGAQRIYAWKLGWNIFLNNPVMGVGQGNYPWHVGNIEEEKGIQWQTRSLSGRAAHSLYFTLLPELGLIGAILYAAIIVFVYKDIKYIKKASKNEKETLSADESKRFYNLALMLEGSLVGFFISSIFISTLYYPNFWFLCGFIVSLKNIVYSKYGDIGVAKTRMEVKFSTA